jgi:hypothetical protein
MDANLQQHLPLIAIALSAAALFFSLVAAFPGLKGVLSAVRDGVLWFALLLVAGGTGFVVWQQLQKQATPATANLNSATLSTADKLDGLRSPGAIQLAPPDPRSAVTP